MNSKTRDEPQNTPKLNPAFLCPEPVKYKRIWHVDTLFGSAMEVVVERTNEDAGGGSVDLKVRSRKRDGNL